MASSKSLLILSFSCLVFSIMLTSCVFSSYTVHCTVSRNYSRSQTQVNNQQSLRNNNHSGSNNSHILSNISCCLFSWNTVFSHLFIACFLIPSIKLYSHILYPCTLSAISLTHSYIHLLSWLALVFTDYSGGFTFAQKLRVTVKVMCSDKPFLFFCSFSVHCPV